MRLSIIISLSLSLILLGCSGNSGNGGDQESGSASQTSDAANTNQLTGTVAETMNGGGYTYVRVENGDEDVWAAGPMTEIAVGDEVTVSLAMPFPQFESKALGRTFDTLYMVGGFGSAGAADPHAGMAMGGKDTGHGSTRVAPNADLAAGSIAVAEGGMSIADLWGGRTDLSGEKVTVRGKVVKMNGGIMGRNWLHLQDGTGESAASTHDLAVTTQDRCNLGDIVTVTGTVTLDKDFGAGYRYDLIVEDAKVRVDESADAGTH